MYVHAHIHLVKEVNPYKKTLAFNHTRKIMKAQKLFRSLLLDRDSIESSQAITIHGDSWLECDTARNVKKKDHQLFILITVCNRAEWLISLNYSHTCSVTLEHTLCSSLFNMFVRQEYEYIKIFNKYKTFIIMSSNFEHS